MSIEAFGHMLDGIRGGCKAVGKALATHLDVPYYEDRDERLLGHRLKTVPVEEALKQGLLSARQFRLPSGAILETNEWPDILFEPGVEFLTEAVRTKDNYPDSYNNVLEAVQKLPHGITGVYFHVRSLNLVLLGPMGEKVGIRASTLSTPIGMVPSEARHLGSLKKAATA